MTATHPDDPSDGETAAPDSSGGATAPPTPAPAAAPLPAAAALAGALAARFEPLRVLGMGGMGVVLLARDRALGREVALKLIRTMAPVLVSMFREEARTLASLEHDHVVRIYEYGVEGQPFIVMELVRGKSLSAHLAAGRPPVSEAVRLAREIARGVEAAHGVGIVHRDLKPANVFLDAGQRAKVADFGLALKVDAHQAGGVAGTPGYMAPEQARGLEVGKPADVYALGVILHEMLSGRRLFTGGTLAAFLAEQEAAAPPPSRANRSVPPELDELVERALARDPAARPPVSELAEVLERWLARVGRRAGAAAASAGLPPLPYKVLVSFGAQDAPIFFGRDAEAAELAGLVANPEVRLIQVFGPCGIGKSSLLAAGLAPALDDRRARVVNLTAGPDPARRVREALAAQAGAGVTAEELALAPARIPAVAREIAAAAGGTLVIVLDQLEEVFTQNPRGSPRIEELFMLIERLADAGGPAKVVLSYRTEFRGELYPLEKRLERVLSAYPVRELDVAGLTEVLEGPSQLEAYGFSFEPGLAARIASEVHETSAREGTSALPTTQIVGHELFEQLRRRGGGTIDTALYERAVGGARGALQRFVEERLADPARASSGAMARQILRALTIKEEGHERFSRARPEEEVLDFPDRERARVTLEALVNDRLVVREDGPEGRRVVRLASEVICPLVDRWSAEPDEVERAARALARAHRQWEEQGRRPEDLLAGAGLSAVAAARGSLARASAGEQAFLAASLAARARWRRRAAAGALAVLAAVSFFAYTAFFKPGTLNLTAEPPDAEFFDGARSLGRAPLAVTLRPGSYTLAVRRDGYDAAKLDVRVPSGGEAAYHPVLSYPRGTLNVSSDPAGATCEVLPLGSEKPVLATTTPFTREVPAGRYTLRYRLAGYLPTRQGPVEVEPNRRLATRACRLERDAGTLQVWGPETAVLTASDRSGKLALTATLPMREPREVESGEYEVVTQQIGCLTDRRRFVMTRGATEGLWAWPRPVRALWNVEVPAGVSGPPVLADVRGDGHPDVLVPVRIASAAEGLNDRRLELLALDGATGERRWSTPLGRCGLPRTEVGDLDGDGKPDAAVNGDERLSALSGLTGKVLWDTPATSFVDPAIVRGPGGPLVLAAEEASLIARDGRTGAVTWSVTLSARIASLSAADVDGDGVDEVAARATGEVSLHAARDGARRWAVRASPDGRKLRALPLARPDADDVVTELAGGIGAIDGRTGRVMWTWAVPAGRGLGHLCAPAPGGNLGISLLQGYPPEQIPHRMIVLDGRAGAVVSDVPTSATPRDLISIEPGTAPLVMAGFEGEPKSGARLDGSIRWTYPPRFTDGSARSSADLDGDGTGDVVMASYQSVAAFSGDSARVRWVFATRDPVSAPGLADLDADGATDLVLNTGEQGVLALSGASGRVLWRTSVGRTQGMPAIAGDGVVVLTSKGALSFLDGRTGRMREVPTPDDKLRRAPLAGDLDGDGRADVVSVTNDRVVAYALDPPRRLWSAEATLLGPEALAVVDLGDTRAAAAAGMYDGVRAFAGKDGALLWHAAGGPVTHLASGAGLFAVTQPSTVSALDPRTGRPRWERGLNAVAPPADPGELSFASGNALSFLRALDVNADGEPDALVAGGGLALTALDGRTGATLWTAKRSPLLPDSLALVPGNPPLVACANEEVELLDGRTGARVSWFRDADRMKTLRVAPLAHGAGDLPDLAIVQMNAVEAIRVRGK